MAVVVLLILITPTATTIDDWLKLSGSNDVMCKYVTCYVIIHTSYKQRDSITAASTQSTQPPVSLLISITVKSCQLNFINVSELHIYSYTSHFVDTGNDKAN